MQWIELNKQMLHLTGDAKYAQEIERSAYNALLGARYTNGVDWSYHSFTNGSWHVAHFNDCCPSSGVMALEELVGEIFSKRENGIAVNLFTDASAKVGKTQISMKTNYPFDGKVEIRLTSKEKLPLFIRIPDWAVNATVNGDMVRPGEYFRTEKNTVELNFPMDLKISQAKEDALVPQGKGEDIYSVNWFALSRGPLVFSANGLIDNRDRERTFSLPNSPNEVFKPVSNPYGSQPAYEMTSGDEKLLFVPYYEAGGAKLNNGD